MSPDLLEYSEEVARARAEGRAVVALESSVWCQGLPEPLGLKAARANCDIIRQAGAVPAILAVRDGRYRIGLSDDELVDMCGNKTVIKVSLRELPTALALGQWGATTVSASLAMGRAAGLDVLATGGIGGVHRHGVWDVSTDLPALASHPGMVFCSGVKSLLDIPATLERLETEGVAVIGYQTDTFPTFYTRTSRYPVTVTVQNEEKLVNILRTCRQMAWGRSVLVAQPVPAADELQGSELEELIDAAHQAAAGAGVAGKHLTPYVLGFLHDKTGGRSLQANMALLEANARLAARVAVASATS